MANGFLSGLIWGTGTVAAAAVGLAVLAPPRQAPDLPAPARPATEASDVVPGPSPEDNDTGLPQSSTGDDSPAIIDPQPPGTRAGQAEAPGDIPAPPARPRVASEAESRPAPRDDATSGHLPVPQDVSLDPPGVDALVDLNRPAATAPADRADAASAFPPRVVADTAAPSDAQSDRSQDDPPPPAPAAEQGDSSTSPAPALRAPSTVTDAPGTAPDAPAPPLEPGPDADSPGPKVDAPPEDTAALVRPQVGFTPAEGVRTDRLPRIGEVGALPDPDSAAAPEADTTPDAGGAFVPDATLPAVLRHAADHSADPGAPRMALVLIDEGLPEALREDLIALPFPVSIAIDPTMPDAPAAAAAYRAAGREVLILATAIPARATAADLEVTFDAHFAAVPEAVGLLDLPKDGFQGNRQLSQLIVPVLERDGHALITIARGLNAADQLAAAAGLAAGQVFRVLDDDRESLFTIRRYLDRAVFEAGRQDTVIVLGRAAYPETLEGIQAWHMEGRSDQVALVPVSAALPAR